MSSKIITQKIQWRVLVRFKIKTNESLVTTYHRRLSRSFTSKVQLKSKQKEQAINLTYTTSRIDYWFLHFYFQLATKKIAI